MECLSGLRSKNCRVLVSANERGVFVYFGFFSAVPASSFTSQSLLANLRSFYLVGGISGDFNDLYFVTPAGRSEVFKLRTLCDHEVPAPANHDCAFHTTPPPQEHQNSSMFS